MTNPTGASAQNDQLQVAVQALTEAFRSAGIGRQSTDDRLPDQKRLVTQFRAIRNGLGNYGRRGTREDRFLLSSPIVSGQHPGPYKLTLVDPLPPERQWVIIRFPDAEDKQRSTGPELTILRPDVVLVELADINKEVIAIGVPTDKSTPPAGGETTDAATSSIQPTEPARKSPQGD